MGVELTDKNFDEIIGKSDKPVMVDFWAAWCGPCRTLAPIVEELSEEFKDTAIVAKVDVDANQEVAANLGIRNIPTIIFFKDGKIVDKKVGVIPKAELAEILKSHM